MKKLIITLVVLLLLTNIGAQNVKYVNTQVPFKEKRLVSSEVVGGIEDMVYVTSTRGYLNKSLRISSYNKDNSSMIKTLAVTGFEKKVANPSLQDAYFSEIIVKNDLLYVVWKRYIGQSSQLILQVFDKDLIEVKQPKVIYQMNNGNLNYGSLFFFMSPNGEKIIAGGEESATKNGNVNIKYKVFDKNQEVINTVQAEQPFSVKGSGGSSSSEYKMDNNGFLYFMVKVNLNDDKKESKKERGNLMGSINPETSEIKTKVFSFLNKTISNSSFEFVDNHLFLVGTYRTKYSKKNKDVGHNNGVFTAKIDKQTFESIGDPIFNELDESKVVFSDYEMSNSQKKKYSMGEYAVQQMVEFGFLVTDYKKTDDNGLIMSINSQALRTVCSDKGGCSHYTDLFGVNYIKLNAEGEIDWISCTAQRMTYRGFVIPENKLAYKDGNNHTVVRSKHNINTSYLINDKTGDVKMAKFKNKFARESSEVVNNELYFVGLNRRESALGVGFLGVGLALIPASIISMVVLSSPLLFIGVGAGVFSAAISLYMKRHNVNFGRYELQE